jgi:spindle assembly abnormal protein 6
MSFPSKPTRFKAIHITVDYQTSIQPSHKTELIIKLTDHHDPFFLYSLFMSEEDYQTLKVEQGLLVDFSAFGQRFIDLLAACEKDEKSDSPKFQLQFYSKEPLPFDHGDASLNVIEINPFKHLYHLSLHFMPGNDADVKKYLATCLQTLRDEHARLTRLHEETKQQLGQQLAASVQALAQRSGECEKLRLEQESQQERLQTKFMQEMNFERDKSMQTQFAAQQRWEKEKKELEAGYGKATKQLEVRVGELESANKELMEKKYKNEAMLQVFIIDFVFFVGLD